MINMKRKAEKADMLASPASSEEYPYGLRLSLGQEELTKLGIEALPAVGTEMRLVAMVKVVSASSSEYEGEGERRDMSMQITKMQLGGDDKDIASKLFG